MALKLGTLDVDLDVNTQHLTTAEKKVTKSTKVMSSAFDKLGATIAGVFATQQLIQMVKATDQMRVLEGRILRVTRTAEGFEKAWASINKSADEAGVSINDSAASFERFLQATEGMGATVDQVGRFNDLILKTGRISGASSQELSNSLTQLSQGFSGGIIRAEEWNSIIEQTPEILRVAARNIDGVNGDLGELRKLMLAGGLTADKFFNAFMRGSDDIEKEFAKVPRSIEQNMQELSNQWSRLLISMDKALGITQKLAASFKAIADGLGKEDTALAKTTRQMSRHEQAITRLTKERAKLSKEMETPDPMFKGIMQQRLDSIDLQIKKQKELLELSKEEVNKLTPKKVELETQLKPKEGPVGPSISDKDLEARRKQHEQDRESAQEVLDDITFRTAEAADQQYMIWSANLDEIDLLRQQGLITEAEMLEAKKALNIEYLDEIDAMEKKQADERAQRNQDQINSIAQMSTAISATLSSIAENSSGGLATAADAFSKFATGIIATSQAMAAAQALADPTALTLPQKLANYATILTSFASIASMASGGRLNGGSVQEGAIHPINENGKSEILEEGGKQFLLGGKNAKVISNNKMSEADGGGGGGLNVSIVNNITGTGEEIDQKLANTMEQSVKRMEAMYVRQMSQKSGKIFSANQQTYGNGKTTGRPM